MTQTAAAKPRKPATKKTIPASAVEIWMSELADWNRAEALVDHYQASR